MVLCLIPLHTALVGATAPASAQTLSIKAVVNDEAISAYDLNQRLNLVIRTSGLRDTPDVRRELTPRIIDSLVDEALQLQEAKRLNITVTKKEMDAAVALIERQNKIPGGGMDQFLKQLGIDKRTLYRQIEASISWSNVVRRNLMRSITVTSEEVSKTLERIKANADKPRILAAEIFIAVDSPRDEANAQQNIRRIFDELRGGANFPQMARQFSHAASAERGGDLGWIVAGELEPALDKVLATLAKGTISEPIRTATGYYILGVRDRREPASRNVGDTVVALRQILLTLPPGASPQAVESQKSLAESIRTSVRGCAEFSDVGKELGAGMSGDLGQLKVSELPSDLGSVVATLDVGAPSTPVVSNDSVRLFMVCDRKAPVDAELPTREEIERRLTLQRLEIRARRYLRDLREAAFLDIRA
jgi:peptidyl-prolyl cis-trans isomerase SurA